MNCFVFPYTVNFLYGIGGEGDIGPLLGFHAAGEVNYRYQYPDKTVHRLEFAVVRIAGEGNHVADVLHAGHEEDQTLEAEAETAVWHGAELAGVEIPVHAFEALVGHALLEFVVAFLTLAAADDLADLREEHVHGAHCLAVVVQLHVERLDFLRIVGQDHWLLEVLLYEVAFVLRSEVDTPIDRELKLLAALFEDLDALCVGKAYEVIFDYEVESLDELLVEVLVEEFDVVLAVLEGIPDAVFDEFLGEVHVVFYLVEGHLGLDHPEL